MGRSARRLIVGLAVTATLALCAPSADAAPVITMRWTGGMGGGLTANMHPQTIARGPGDVMWFTAWGDPGVVARATNGVNQLVGGSTPGFTANARPTGIALGPDGNMWFTEIADPGRVGRVTPALTFTEFPAGPTANRSPTDIAAGPDGNVWFVKAGGAGYVVRMTPAGAATELVGGVTPGFTANALPSGIATGPDGNVWYSTAAPGRIGVIDPATLAVREFDPASRRG
jgi:streptogramin lyase